MTATTATITPPQTQRITLYYREGSSDKVYQAVIEPQGEGFVVNFAYGRRGSTMNTGTKTQTPVDYDTATKIFTKLVNEKKAKGYTEGPDGTPYQNTPKEDRVTGLLPQLLNPIDEQEVKRLFKDPAWAMQEKFDGRRVLVRKAGAEIHGINRKGLLIGLPSPIVVGAHKITSDFILDGECVGTCCMPSICWNGMARIVGPSLISAGSSSSPTCSTGRTSRISSLPRPPPTRPTKSGCSVICKLRERKAWCSSDWMPPTPLAGPTAAATSSSTSSTPPVLPWSPRSTTSGASNCGCSMGRAGFRCGNVTIPPNFKVPAVGDVVECRYLYAFRESNALYQPVYLGPRQDIEQHECVLSQLKYKGTGEEDLC